MTMTIESLFENFLNAAPVGEHAEEMHRLSAEIDRQIAAGNVDADLIGEYELASMKYGFYAGLKAGLELKQQGEDA